jgi:hypothetical protein
MDDHFDVVAEDGTSDWVIEQMSLLIFEWLAV